MSTVDFAPTFLGMLGLEAPASMEGMNLSHLALDQAGPEPDAAFLQGTGATANWDTGHEWRAMRNKRYTYARFRINRPSADQELLFDNVNDPFQRTNLASNEKHKILLKELQTRLAGKMRSIDDTFEASTWQLDTATRAAARATARTHAGAARYKEPRAGHNDTGSNCCGKCRIVPGL